MIYVVAVLLALNTAALVKIWLVLDEVRHNVEGIFLNVCVFYEDDDDGGPDGDDGLPFETPAENVHAFGRRAA